MIRRTTSASAVAAAARNAVAFENLELRRLLSYDLAATYTDTADGSAYEWFGSSVAVNGNLALVGSVGRTAAITNDGGETYTEVDTTAGQATLIDTTTGNILRTFHNPVVNPQTGDAFGGAVAFVDGKLAISAIGSRTVYIYDDYADDVPERSYFYANPEAVGFGASMTTQGDDLLVGVLQTNMSGDMNGAILRYDLDSVSGDPAQTYLNPDDSSPGNTVDQFGYNMTSDGTYIYSRVIVGGTAEVVIMDNDGNLVQVYHAQEGDTAFGSALAAPGDGTVFISDVSNGTVHHVDTAGNLLNTFVIPNQGAEGFPVAANSLAVVDGKLIAGNPTAPELDETEQFIINPGYVYVFDVDSAALEQSIRNPGYSEETFPDLADTEDSFGSLVAALPDGRFFVSAIGENNENGIDAGTIYIYEPEVAPPSNSAPTDLNITGASTAVRQQTIEFTGSFTDADGGDSHTVAWDFGDGNTIAAHATTDAGALTVSHAYTTSGSFTVTMTISDGVNAPVSTTFGVSISASAVVGGTMYLGGTSGTDTVVLVKNLSGGTVVTVNGVTTTTNVSHIVVYGGAGADLVDASKSINAALEVYGGAGNDTVKAGGTGDIIVGGDGDDNLSGGKGRDVVIGGTGADSVMGDQDNDVLIAGSTVHDDDSGALNSILGVWNSMSYASAVSTLQSTTLRPDVDVHDDGVVDRLTGGAGQDWFVYQNSNDIIVDAKKDELATDL